MGARAILLEMNELLHQQIDAVVAGNYTALTDGAARHEALLAALDSAERDLPPEELRTLVIVLNAEKAKLSSLLEAQSGRTDFMLRLILGGTKPRAGSYPVDHWQPAGQSQRLNRRT